MIEARDRLDLALEAHARGLEPKVIGAHELDRGELAGFDLAREVDLAHAARADALEPAPRAELRRQREGPTRLVGGEPEFAQHREALLDPGCAAALFAFDAFQETRTLIDLGLEHLGHEILEGIRAGPLVIRLSVHGWKVETRMSANRTRRVKTRALGARYRSALEQFRRNRAPPETRC